MSEAQTKTPNAKSAARTPSLWQAIAPVALLLVLLAANVGFYGEDSSYGPNQIALLISAAVAGLMGVMLRIPVTEMMEGVRKAISSTLIAILILLLIGSLAGTWMMSGIVPAMIYFGLDIMNPTYFLVATSGICAVVSVVTGSSWSTVATVGIALLGIGTALGMNVPMTAGAIISGAYFGDKISPLSDTTNLAAAMAGTDLITHIKYMLWTTIPSFLIAAGIFTAIGLSGDVEATTSGTTLLKEQIANNFNLQSSALIFMFAVPILVLVMVLMKFDAIVALFIGAIAAGLIAVVFQPEVVTKIAGLDLVEVTVNDEEGERKEMRDPAYIKRAYVAFINSMAFSTQLISDEAVEDLESQKKELEGELERKCFESAQQDDPDLTMEDFREKKIVVEDNFAEIQEPLDKIVSQISAASLLKGKGMVGMLNTVWLILTAMCFGGIMEACGLLQRMTEPLIRMATTRGSLVATTAGGCLLTNVTASDQYLAIVLPGRMFGEAFREQGLAPENLSRTLEDSGTMTSVLIPWNTCGAAQQAVLGVDVLAFAPWCLFNIISPLMTVLYAYLGINIHTLDDKQAQPKS